MDDPKTWDDYFGAAAKNKVVAAQAGHPEIKAVNAAQLSVDDEMLTITAQEAIWAAGGVIVGPNGQLVLTPDGSKVIFGPNDLNGLNKLAAAANDPDIVLPEAVSSSAEVAAKAFADGRTAYMRNWPVARDNIGDNVSFGVVAPPSPSVLSYSTRPDAGQIQLALNNARLRAVTPCYVEFSRRFREGVSRALHNNGVPEADFPAQLAAAYNCT